MVGLSVCEWRAGPPIMSYLSTRIMPREGSHCLPITSHNFEKFFL